MKSFYNILKPLARKYVLRSPEEKLIKLLAESAYPPVDRDEVYKEIFEQAENFKKYRGA